MKKLNYMLKSVRVENFRPLLIAFCFLLFAFCFLPSALFAQKSSTSASNDENKRLFYGISVGPTIDWFSPTINDLQRKKITGGMVAGFNLDINLSKQRMFYFSTGVLIRYLQGELSYSKQYDLSSIVPIDTMTKMSTVTNYQTTYLTIPTGFKFRTTPSNNCVFVGKLGLYHNFKIGGKQFDSFSTTNSNAKPDYYITTPKIKNDAAALFAESGYIGLGFEYALVNNFRVFANVDYSCQFNYFSSKNLSAKNNITNERFKTIVHSLHIVVGVSF
jgi:hypothetical protein